MQLNRLIDKINHPILFGIRCIPLHEVIAPVLHLSCHLDVRRDLYAFEKIPPPITIGAFGMTRLLRRSFSYCAQLIWVGTQDDTIPKLQLWNALLGNRFTKSILPVGNRMSFRATTFYFSQNVCRTRQLAILLLLKTATPNQKAKGAPSTRGLLKYLNSLMN